MFFTVSGVVGKRKISSLGFAIAVTSLAFLFVLFFALEGFPVPEGFVVAGTLLISALSGVYAVLEIKNWVHAR